MKDNLDDVFRRYGDTLTTAEVAQVLQVSVKCVRMMLTAGEPCDRLPGYRLGKSWIVVASELKTWLQALRNV